MSWKRVQLSEVLIQQKETVELKSNEEYTLVTISKTGAITKRETKKGVEIKGKSALKIKSGDFIYSRLAVHSGAFGIIPKELNDAIVTNEMPSFKIKDNILPEFLIHSLTLPDFNHQITQLTKGVGRTRVKEKSFLGLEINLPTLSQQKQIVTWLASCSNISDDISANQIAQLDLVKQLRQAFLREAMQGKLVPQYPNDEPASVLLEKIKAEKDKWIKGKVIKKPKPIPPILDYEIPFDIPKNWTWCRLGEFAYVTSGSTPKSSAFVSEGIPFLKMYNLRDQKIDFDYKQQFIMEEVHNGALKRCRAFPGDLIMNIVGPPLGKLAIIPDSLPECNFNQAAVLIRPTILEMNKYLFWYLSEMSEINEVETKGVAGQNNISVSQAHNMKIPLPPLSEQQRIVAKLDELMQYCDELEVSIKESQTQNELLLQQVLREALEPKEKEVEKV